MQKEEETKLSKNNLFGNVASNIINKINFLSSNILDLKNNYSSVKNSDINFDTELYSKEKLLNKQETYFEKLFEVYSRSVAILNCEKEFFQMMEILQKSMKTYFEECKEKKEEMIIEMNKILENTKNIEKELKKNVFNDEYEENNYNEFIHETEQNKKKKQQQIEAEEREAKRIEEERIQEMIEEEKIIKECEEKEKNRLKKIEEEEKEKVEKENVKKVEAHKNNISEIVTTDMLSEKEIEMLEEKIGKKVNGIIFDSTKDKWSLNENTFPLKMKNKSNFLIIIETTEGKRFGCYINSLVNSLGQYIPDENAFIFNFENNSLKTYLIINDKHAIKINDEQTSENNVLFSIGNGDIIVNKFEKKENSCCTQTSFYYETTENVLLGEKQETFDIKKFLVIQMEMTLKEQKDCILSDKIFVSEKEVQIIENWCDMTLNDVIFDSNYDDWKIGTSVFHEKLFGKENIIIIIEEEKGNVFGVFLNTIINDIRIVDEDELFYGRTIADMNAFTFSLRSNGRIPQPEKYPMREEYMEWAFQLFDENFPVLCNIGGGNDIAIMRDGMKLTGTTVQSSFDYLGKQDVFVGKSGENNPFNVKQIQVWQMVMTEEQKMKKEEKEKNVFEEELKKLKDESENIKKRMTEEINQIELLTEMKYDRVVFDTEFCDWEIHTTQFIKHIFGREKLVFLIEDTNGNMFGGFINTVLNEMCWSEKAKFKGNNIKSANSFVFSLKSKGEFVQPEKFMIKSGIEIAFLF